MPSFKKSYFLLFIFSLIYFFAIRNNCFNEKSADINTGLIADYHEWYEVQDLTSNELEHYHFGRRGGGYGGSVRVFPFVTKYKHIYNYALVNIGDSIVKVRYFNGSPKIGDCIPINITRHSDDTSTIIMNFQKYRLDTDFNQCR